MVVRSNLNLELRNGWNGIWKNSEPKPLEEAGESQEANHRESTLASTGRTSTIIR